MSAPRTAELTLADKHDRLREIIAGYGSALVCFSGGVDSTLLLRVAHDVLGERCVGADRRLDHDGGERAHRRARAGRRHRRRLEVVESHELERPGFAQNPTDRCYHCKAELLEIARPRADALGLAEVLIGTNLDDLGDHRPGLAAANERGARHPMVDAGFTKPDVRALSPQPRPADLGQAAARLPVVALPLRHRDHRRAAAPGRRVRGRAARARLPPAARPLPRRRRAPRDRSRRHAARARAGVREAIVAAGRAHGFTFVALDLAGFASGSLNQLIALRKR